MHIYIGFSSPKHFKIGAAAIKLWTNSPYSHAYIRFESSSTKIGSSVYHAAHGMVHFRKYENFLKENKVIKEYTIDISAQDRETVLAHCMNLAGEPYSVIELLKILCTDIAHYYGYKIDLGDSHGYICSELVAKILVGILDITFDKPIYLIKPKDIDQKLQSIYGVNG